MIKIKYYTMKNFSLGRFYYYEMRYRTYKYGISNFPITTTNKINFSLPENNIQEKRMIGDK